MIYHCEKCYPNSKSLHESGLPCKLIGGYATSLCHACNREWHRFIRGHEAYKEFSDLEIDKYLLSCRFKIVPPGEATIQKYREVEKQLRHLEDVLFQVAEKWMQEKQTDSGPGHELE